MERSGISVIIPMLNSEKYIEQCILSILRQGDMVKEIICVDNGSKDRTGEMVLRMQKTDNRIRFISCDKKGVSAARNCGLEHVDGRYVMFVDSDDYLQGKKLPKLYKKAVKCDADILVFGGTSTQPLKTPHWVRRVLSPRKQLCLVSEYPNIFEERGVVPATWNKLYKAELLKDLRFPEQLRIAEDKLFQFFAFTTAERILFLRERIYVYRIHQNSVMNHIEAGEKEAQHGLAVQLAEEWVHSNRPKQSMIRGLENFKRTFIPKTNSSKGILKVKFYVREYGFRSSLELILGQIIYKKV